MITLRIVIMLSKSFQKHINPRNEKQARYVELMTRERPYIVVASGHAGTGKSILAASVGIDKLKTGMVDKIIITRPAVCVDDEQHGFLPGTLDEKMEPWIRPITDVIEKRCSKDEMQRMFRSKAIEIVPLAYMRGRTFENSWIICDEAQNCTPAQLLMLLTRLGENSKVVITGDPFQHDRGAHTNGLTDLMLRVESTNVTGDIIDHVYFDESDVVRHPAIKFILSMYHG